jgi:3-oxoacyl-[acyl-carrier-protein] synthase-3
LANLEFKSCKMVGLATSVPEMIRSTESFSSFIGEEGVKKFIKNVGMKQGHISSPDMTTSDLCFSAANQLLDRLNIDRNSIDVLLFVSQTPDYVAPSTACVLQYRLDLSQECLAFDVNLAWFCLRYNHRFFLPSNRRC